MDFGVIFPLLFPLFRFGKGMRGIIVAGRSYFLIWRRVVGLLYVMYVTTVSSESKLPSTHKRISICWEFIHG